MKAPAYYKGASAYGPGAVLARSFSIEGGLMPIDHEQAARDLLNQVAHFYQEDPNRWDHGWYEHDDAYCVAGGIGYMECRDPSYFGWSRNVEDWSAPAVVALALLARHLVVSGRTTTYDWPKDAAPVADNEPHRYFEATVSNWNDSLKDAPSHISAVNQVISALTAAACLDYDNG